MTFCLVFTILWVSVSLLAFGQTNGPDTDQDGKVSMTELVNYIDRWKVSSVDVTLRDVMDAIRWWKTGSPADPCVNVTCNSPPAAACANSTAKRVYSSPGTCSNGTCTYPYTDMACSGSTPSCSAGICICTPSSCPPGQTCQNGSCVLPVCGNGIVEGDEECDDGNTADGDGCNSSCEIVPINVNETDEIRFQDIGFFGIFDPSLQIDGSRIWMSYSAVDPPLPFFCSNKTLAVRRIETHLAYSDDHGATWEDDGIINPTENACLPAPYYLGSWQNEVSSLVKDDSAPAGERWKIFWHHYLWVQEDGSAIDDPNDVSHRRFEFGWIGMRAASTPELLKTAPEKRLAAAAYQAIVLGDPDVYLSNLNPDLANCLVFTEPGALGNGSGVYIELFCGVIPDTENKLVLLKYNGNWSYIGTSMTLQDANLIGSTKMVNAPELYDANNQTYMIFSKVIMDVEKYDGCQIVRINLTNGAIEREGQVPKILKNIQGTPSNFNGACGYDIHSNNSGIILGELNLSSLPVFHIYNTHINYP